MKGKNDFISALLKEMALRRDYIGDEKVETVYFGGGTPSLLETDDLLRVMDGLRAGFDFLPDAEITLEANPDDIISEGRLEAWGRMGINRLSIGVQSFFDADLRWMNRAHDAGQANTCIRMAQDAGFTQLSIDLIYGGPTLPDDNWRYNVENAIALNIPHLSCYALTVEPRTPLEKMIRQHRSEDPSPEDQARQFLLLMDWTARAGYEHYEISNFARPGHRSRHNSSYWQGKTYLGLGPSAHSFDGLSRQWNVANNARYNMALNGEKPEGIAVVAGLPVFVAEKEVLTPVQRLNEYIMTSLRTLEGCDLRLVAERFGVGLSTALEERAVRHVNNGSLTLEINHLRLTREGRLLADGIAADLFVMEKRQTAVRFSDDGGGSSNTRSPGLSTG
jgi:oxygen-independent coproporphyrinogen-3 oxidase